MMLRIVKYFRPLSSLSYMHRTLKKVKELDFRKAYRGSAEG